MVHVVGLRAAQRIEPAKLFQRREVLGDFRRNPVLRQLLADGSVQPFRRGAVVAPDVEDEGVVELPLPLDLIDHPAGIVVGMFGEAGEDLHQPALERLLVLRNRVPGRHRCRARRQLGGLGNPAHRLGPGESALAVLVPAVVELAPILVGPLLHDLVRTMRRTRRPVHEERLVRCVGVLLAEPMDGVGRDVVGEVIALGEVLGHLRRVADQGRLVLRRLPGEESVEVFEAVAGRPIVERTLGGDLLLRRIVPLAPGAGVVAVVLEDFSDGRRRLGDRYR